MVLCYVMYKYVKLAGGQSLFAEIHQQNSMSMVQVVVANTPEAKHLVLMINK